MFAKLDLIAMAMSSCLKIEQVENIACHTGRETCFYQKLDDKGIWINDHAVIRP